jgi:hypothetical protein
MQTKFIFAIFLILITIFLSVRLDAQLQEAVQISWPGFEVLRGRWQDRNGRGAINIRNISTTGSIELQFDNPEPVHVTQAQAARDGKETKLLILVRYPHNLCCFYNLVYDPVADQLKGIFWPKGSAKTTEVVFDKLGQLP